jgi:hypothetical protein
MDQPTSIRRSKNANEIALFVGDEGAVEFSFGHFTGD